MIFCNFARLSEGEVRRKVSLCSPSVCLPFGQLHSEDAKTSPQLAPVGIVSAVIEQRYIVSSSAQNHQLLRRHDRRLTVSFLLARSCDILDLQGRWNLTCIPCTSHRSFAPFGLAINERSMRLSNLKHCSSLLIGNRRM
jgi:hypothetical protein